MTGFEFLEYVGGGGLRADFLEVLAGLFESVRGLEDLGELGRVFDLVGELVFPAIGEGDGFLGHGAAEGVVEDGDAGEDGFAGEAGAGAAE